MSSSQGGSMKHYRVNKVVKPNGPVIKARDTLAASDREAIEYAKAHPDCPICEVWREGKKVGAIT